MLFDKANSDTLLERKLLNDEFQRATMRSKKVSDLYAKVYEDNAEGKVTDEWFYQLSQKYELERLELKNKISNIRKKLTDIDSTEHNMESFIKAVRKFMKMEYLSAPILRELIDHIDVYETEGTGKNKTQRIVIYYRFVGYVEIPIVEQKKYVMDMRQGVAVEYIPEEATKKITA